ncbi:glycosyltransferase [Larkinella sp. GY13]|uniref:glycosyltransferase n=1 Tax=Larkinella sp. GY13 TaxID=3453720 RepID=UPI003EE9F77F
MIVSVIIPTLNRSCQLQRTLYSLSQLPEDRTLFEIIVIDNGSTNETERVVKTFIEENNRLDVRYFYDPVPGLLTGRHRGAQEARGETFTFIDDDVQVCQTWLSAIIEVMRSQPGISLLTGPCLPLYEIPPPYWVSNLWRSNEMGKYCGWFSLLDFGGEPRIIDPDFVWGLNFTIRRDAFFKLGGFHPDSMPDDLQIFQGDGETGLTRKAKEQGILAFYHPRVKLLHEVPQTRLTPEYIKKRAFFQGVCNSFSKEREEKYKYKLPSLNSKIRKPSLISSFKRNCRELYRKINFSFNRPEPDLISELNAEEMKGYEFHKKAFDTRPEVRDWVLQENYLNYELPTIYD